MLRLRSRNKKNHSVHQDLESIDKLLNTVSLNKISFTRNLDLALANHPYFRPTEERTNSIDILDFEFVSKYVNYNLSIDRKTFLTAISDPECKKLMVCLIFGANSTCFSGFKPQDKAVLVRILKENLVFDPVVLAVGNSICDIPMI